MEMAKKMPWEAPDTVGPTYREIQEERRKDRAFGDTIEGGCWFSHVGGIDEMEKSYGRRSRRFTNDPAEAPESEQRDKSSDSEPVPEP